MDQLNNDVNFIEKIGGEVRGGFGVIERKCPHLRGISTCDIYESKPDFCNFFPGEKDKVDLKWLEAIGCKYFG